ncbi:endolytic transglycosylase MltG [Desulfospira joergensenii]|uniref:endolytic transglycosylase MltG n=1 Tax=Desulfospira joergensenii TaxID=53329 RepID=UPI0003B363E6|nr:endolytic transglycosylase MltG [Desulfospira joergensenii]
MKKRVKPIIWGSCILLIMVALAAAYTVFRISHCMTTPLDPDPEKILFTISPGQGLNTIAAHLEARGLIAHKTCFKLYARYKKAASRLKAGEYMIAASQAPARILDIFVQGKERLFPITIPEGLNMDEIAQRIAETGFCTRENFLKLCRDPEFIRSLDIESHTLEGYLFPDTYFFPNHTGCQKIIRKMTATFHSVFTPEWRARAKEMGFSVQEIVTLASMIEKETADPSERPLISSVFHNRLKKRMRLESDPTVIYGDKDFKGRIRTKHLRRSTPYNTYRIFGLPLGPIANPGALALKAALFPEPSSFFFFVSKNDRTHYFSKTLAEHNRAVRKYQLKGSSNH